MYSNYHYVVLAEGKFGPLQSKTANQMIRYAPHQVVAVIDSTKAGIVADQVLGFGGHIPLVACLNDAMAFQPDALLIGVAPTGGRLPEEWRPVVSAALQLGLNIVSGLHTFLSDDPEFSQLATMKNRKIFDLRKVPSAYEVVAKGCWKTRKAKTILSVGTDCNVGKMTVSLELHREFVRRGLSSDFIATGQTGILLSGKGIAVDSLAGDYIAGAIEKEIERVAARGATYLHVEGQGSLTHQGYSGVTMGLLHGVMPDAMILVHHPIRRYDDYGFSLTDVPRLIGLHEHAVRLFKSSKIVAIAINTVGMKQDQIEDAKIQLEKTTGLPVGDVLTPDVGKLADAVRDYFQTSHVNIV